MTIHCCLALLSGFSYGAFELISLHRSTKLDALRNWWAFVYLLGTSAMAAFVFAVLSDRNPQMFGLFADSRVNGSLLALAAGPLTGVCLRHVGTKGRVGTSLLSFHDRFFSFLHAEVQQRVDLARLQLSKDLESQYTIQLDALAKLAYDYIDSTRKKDADRRKERRFIAELVSEKEKGALTLARFIVDAYGAKWVRTHLHAIKTNSLVI